MALAPAYSATVGSQILGNTLACISQEIHKICNASVFPRSYKDLIVVILVYNLSVLILINWYNLSNFKSRRRNSCGNREIK